MERLLYLEPEQDFNGCLHPSWAFCQLLPYSSEQPHIPEVSMWPWRLGEMRKILDYVTIGVMKKNPTMFQRHCQKKALFFLQRKKKRPWTLAHSGAIARGGDALRNEMLVATLQSSGVMPGSRCVPITQSGLEEQRERTGVHIYPVVQQRQHNRSQGLMYRQGLCSSICIHSGAVSAFSSLQAHQ